jgi:hypothetical protein
MSLLKRVKDHSIKFLLGRESVPRGLFELEQYFRAYGAINFNCKKNEEGIVAVSANFKYGSIIASGKNKEELDKNIKDAILTAFSIPSSYKKEAGINRVGDRQKEYAFA